MWYSELEGQSDIVEKLSTKFCDQGINKSKLEVSYYQSPIFLYAKHIFIHNINIVKFDSDVVQ